MEGPVPRGDSELNRVLRSAFKPPAKPRRLKGRKLREAGLGDWGGTGENNNDGLVPGLMYGGGKQTQRGGMRGTRNQELIDELAGIPNCPPWLNPECLNVFSRFLETTFRNFQQHVGLPSWLFRPFISRCIDAFPTPAAGAGGVTIPGGSYAAGAFVEVACFRIPTGRNRGVINRIGQSAESAAAFDDLEWRITRNGTPVECYNAIRIQIGNMLDLGEIILPQLIGGDRVCLEAASLSVAAHTVLGRLQGWWFPVRTEDGASVKSTIVD